MALLRASIRGLQRACSLLPRSCGRGAKRRVCLIRLVGRRCARPPRLPARRSRDKPPRGHHTSAQSLACRARLAFIGAMQVTERLRARMAAAGVELPPELIDVVAMAAGPMITSLDALLALDLGDIEPFSPARRLPDDAA